jgi:hypothetical protein
VPDADYPSAQPTCGNPLVAIADAAGGDWPQRARAACRALAADVRPEPDTAGEKLLADLYDVWPPVDDELFMGEVIDLLCGIEESPWSAWHRGDRISPRGLAALLKPWHVESRNIRRNGQQAKGYTRADLADA